MRLPWTPNTVFANIPLCLFETLKVIIGQPARRPVAGSERHLIRQQRKLQKEHRTRKSG
jgi:hypothetical protein